MIPPSVHGHNAESGFITSLAVGTVSLLLSLPPSLSPSFLPSFQKLSSSDQVKRKEAVLCQTHPNRLLPIDRGGVILNENFPVQTQHHAIRTDKAWQ